MNICSASQFILGVFLTTQRGFFKTFGCLALVATLCISSISVASAQNLHRDAGYFSPAADRFIDVLEFDTDWTLTPTSKEITFSKPGLVVIEFNLPSNEIPTLKNSALENLDLSICPGVNYGCLMTYISETDLETSSVFYLSRSVSANFSESELGSYIQFFLLPEGGITDPNLYLENINLRRIFINGSSNLQSTWVDIEEVVGLVVNAVNIVDIGPDIFNVGRSLILREFQDGALAKFILREGTKSVFITSLGMSDEDALRESTILIDFLFDALETEFDDFWLNYSPEKKLELKLKAMKKSSFQLRLKSIIYSAGLGAKAETKSDWEAWLAALANIRHHLLLNEDLSTPFVPDDSIDIANRYGLESVHILSSEAREQLQELRDLYQYPGSVDFGQFDALPGYLDVYDVLEDSRFDAFYADLFEHFENQRYYWISAHNFFPSDIDGDTIENVVDNNQGSIDEYVNLDLAVDGDFAPRVGSSPRYTVTSSSSLDGALIEWTFEKPSGGRASGSGASITLEVEEEGNYNGLVKVKSNIGVQDVRFVLNASAVQHVETEDDRYIFKAEHSSESGGNWGYDERPAHDVEKISFVLENAAKCSVETGRCHLVGLQVGSKPELNEACKTGRNAECDFAIPRDESLVILDSRDNAHAFRIPEPLVPIFIEIISRGENKEGELGLRVLTSRSNNVDRDDKRLGEDINDRCSMISVDSDKDGPVDYYTGRDDVMTGCPKPLPPIDHAPFDPTRWEKNVPPTIELSKSEIFVEGRAKNRYIDIRVRDFNADDVTVSIAGEVPSFVELERINSEKFRLNVTPSVTDALVKQYFDIAVRATDGDLTSVSSLKLAVGPNTHFRRLISRSSDGVYRFFNQESKCLVYAPEGDKEEQLIFSDSCSGEDSGFIVDFKGSIRPYGATHKCVDFFYGSNAIEHVYPASVWNCHGKSQQRLRFESSNKLKFEKSLSGVPYRWCITDQDGVAKAVPCSSGDTYTVTLAADLYETEELTALRGDLFMIKNEQGNCLDAQLISDSLARLDYTACRFGVSDHWWVFESLDSGEFLIRSFAAPGLALSLPADPKVKRDYEGRKVVSLSPADSSSVHQRFTITQNIKSGNSCLLSSESFSRKVVQSDDLEACSNYQIETYQPPFEGL